MSYFLLRSKKKLLGMLIIVVLSLSLASGCSLFPEQDKLEQEIIINPGDTIRQELTIAAGEIVEGRWQGSDGIVGSYRPPAGSLMRWSASSAVHDFTADGVQKPGLYVFEFTNTSNNPGTLLFSYTITIQTPGQ